MIARILAVYRRWRHDWLVRDLKPYADTFNRHSEFRRRTVLRWRYPSDRRTDWLH